MKKKNTFRLTEELDQALIQEANKLGISKNACVQILLSKALKIKFANDN